MTIKKHIWEAWSFLLSSIMVTLMIVALTWWVLRQTKESVYTDLKYMLEQNLDTTHTTVLAWIDRISKETTFFAEIVKRHISAEIFQEIQTNQFSNFHQEVKKSGILDSTISADYILTNSAGMIASSSRDDRIGEKFEPPQEIAAQIDKAPYRAVHIFQEASADELLKHNILFASRLSGNNGTLFLLVSPQKELKDILRRSFLGQEGEIYMVNSKGQFLSEGRWKNEMIRRKWLTTEKASPIGIKISETWRDAKAPLTQAVASVTKGESNKEISKYKNYLGTEVVGLWRWNDTYRFGLVTEMKSEEAFEFFEFYKKQILLGTFFTILLVLTLTFLFIWNRLRISTINEQLSDTYKTIKKQNDKHARDLLMGKKVQMDMLPNKINGEQFVLDAYLSPAQTVSGDFYDFSFVGNDKLYFCVGDVSGKGIGAALFMSMAKVSLNKTLTPSIVVSELVENVNKELSRQNTSCMFVTLAVGIMDLRMGTIHITNAGHNPPYLKKANGELILLEKIDGPLIGTFAEAKFEQQFIQMSKQDILLFYTDGVTEAQNSKEEFYEDERLKKLLECQQFSSPRQMVKIISEDVVVFMEKADQFDDITLLSLQYLG